MSPIMAECDQCGELSPLFKDGSEAQLWLDEHQCEGDPEEADDG